MLSLALVNTVAALSDKTGHSIEDVAEGIAALAAHGLIKDGQLAIPDDPEILAALPADLRKQLQEAVYMQEAPRQR